jgi:hypothetical protein
MSAQPFEDEILERRKFVLDIELSERICLLFVRKVYGRELVLEGEPVKGFEAVESKSYMRASVKTYPKHAELPQKEYDLLLTLLSQEAYVRRTLGRGGMDAIIADAEDFGFRMPRWRADRLRMNYKRIALRFKIGGWE